MLGERASNFVSIALFRSHCSGQLDGNHTPSAHFTTFCDSDVLDGSYNSTLLQHELVIAVKVPSEVEFSQLARFLVCLQIQRETE